MSLAHRLGFLSDESCLALCSKAEEASKVLNGLIRSLRTPKPPVSSLLPDHRLTVFQLLKYMVRINEQRLRDGLPRFSIELFDLSGYADDQLRGEAFMQATLLLLKYILRPELPGELARIFGLLSAIQHQPHGLDCIKLLLNYVAQGMGVT